MDTITPPRARPKKISQFFDYSKGQNSFDDPLILPANFLTTARNVRINRTGQVLSRLGQTQIGNTIHATNPILGLYEYQDEAGTKVRFTHVDTVLYELVTATWTNRKTIATDELSFVTFKGSYGSAVTSGTSTSGTTNTLVDTAATWTPDAYRGYILKDTTTGELKVIESNTATVITIEGKWDTIPTTDGYEIYATKSIVYACNGTDKFKIMASNSIADLTAGGWTTFKRLAVHNNRLFAWLNNSSRMQYSDLGCGENFPDLNFIDVNNGDGDSIRGAGAGAGVLVICKERSAWILAGSGRDNFSLQNISLTAGCIAPKSLVASNGIVFFLGYEGVYKTDGRSAPVLVSKNIKDKIDATTLAQRLDANAVIDVMNGHYISTVGTETFTSDINRDNWVWDDGYTPNVFANAEDADGSPIILMGDDTQGIVWQMDSGNDDRGDQTITSVVETVKIPGGKYGIIKGYGRGRIFFQATTWHTFITVEANVEDQGYNVVTALDTYQDFAEWDIAEWDISEWSAAETIISKFKTKDKGRYIQLRWTKNDDKEPVTFYGLTFTFKERRFK